MLTAIFDFNPRVNTMTPIVLRKRIWQEKPVFLIVYHIHSLNAIIDSVYKYFKLHSIYDNMESWRKEKNDR